MPDPFDGYQFFTYLRTRWRLPAVVVGVALLVSLAVTLLVSKKYTARVTLVIDPPAMSDPRSSTVVSPIYLESLKTYEHLASSDQLFLQAVDRFQLRGPRQRSLEGLKREVLQVTIPRNTKILEIAATLLDPQRAHALALYIAQETITLNRKTNRASDDELIADTRKRLGETTRRRDATETARNRAATRAPTPEGLKADLEELRGVREEIVWRSLSSPLSERLRQQAADIDRQIASKQAALARRTTEIDSLSGEHEAAWTAHEELTKRLRDLEYTAGLRGERLTLLDPGVPPERPSSPNLPLNVLVAAGFALIASLLYLTAEFSVQSQKAETVRKTIRMATKA